MSKYRRALPQLSDQVFLTDGGIETCLIFHDGIELPYFAAFDLLKSEKGRATLERYFRRYAELARDSKLGFIFESPTWRASADWGNKLDYSRDALADVNRRSIALMAKLRAEYETLSSLMVISGCVGPRGDGYRPDNRMTADEAESYHRGQIRTFAATEADMITAITMTTIEEAIGVTRAARAFEMPVAISFTLETDGTLPAGQSLKEAILAVDAATKNAPAYYMINCAHPTHFMPSLPRNEGWTARIKGLRANASKRSHAELDASTDLDAGDPVELGQQYREVRLLLPSLTVLGGCCGTDHRHVEAIAHACAA